MPAMMNSSCNQSFSDAIACAKFQTKIHKAFLSKARETDHQSRGDSTRPIRQIQQEEAMDKDSLFNA
jgi:hypothetical protein